MLYSFGIGNDGKLKPSKDLSLFVNDGGTIAVVRRIRNEGGVDSFAHLGKLGNHNQAELDRFMADREDMYFDSLAVRPSSFREGVFGLDRGTEACAFAVVVGVKKLYCNRREMSAESRYLVEDDVAILKMIEGDVFQINDCYLTYSGGKIYPSEKPSYKALSLKNFSDFVNLR